MLKREAEERQALELQDQIKNLSEDDRNESVTDSNMLIMPDD